MSWYFIDSAGTTQGPVELKVLETNWNGGQMNADTYVWNGTTVNTWSLVKDTILFAKLNKPKPAAPSGGSRPAPKRPKPSGGAAGGGRMNLLDAIRSGKALKKAATPAVKKKPAGKMSLQEQLAMRLKKGGSKGGGAKAKPKPKPAANRTAAAPKKSYNSSQPAKKFGANKKAPSGGAAPKKYKLKQMIDECTEDWVLKAVEKLLKQ